VSGTVVDRLRERARQFPDSVALVDATGGASFTYAELFDRAARVASALVAQGLRKSDAVLAYLPNAHEAVECELAALASGFAWITLTARLTWPEVRGVVVACAPRLIVTDPAGARAIRDGLAAFPVETLPPLVITGGGATASEHAGAQDYEAWIRAAQPVFPSRDVDREDPARLRYTSGTTGTAKAAVLPHRVYHASLDTLLDELGPWTAADRALHVAPLTHGAGALVYPTLHAGGTNVLRQHFDVNAVLSDVEQHRVTTLFTVPTMLSRLVSAPDFGAYDLSSLRAVVYGGAPMPEAQLALAVAKLGHALVQIYGMTEAPWPITVLKPADHTPKNPRLHSVGRATRTTEVRIGDGARELASGDVGEIHVRGDNVMTGYFADDASTREVLSGGWLATGDVGKMDDDGYLFIVGRQKDVIISGGFNVYPSEVEAAISSIDGVLEVAVVGLPHDDWGELVAAFVVSTPGARLSREDVEVATRRRLSGYKCPRRIEIVSDLPKNPSGKIQKRELVRRVTAAAPGASR
jgi:acyl-CoA synthetase (AMP-forming)/AMP-acid ligase II